MLSKTKAIVLSKIKYKESDLIVKCYTLEYGVLSFLVRGVLKSRKSSIKAAYFLPLSQLEIVFNYSQNKALLYFKEVKPYSIYTSLQLNILKSTVALFLSEILTTTLKEEEKNEALFFFLETSFQWFDTEKECANFHLAFLLQLTKYLGFYPDAHHQELSAFNLYDGCFEMKSSGKYSLTGENLILLKRLLGTTFDALNTIKINASQRQSFLNVILLYFELHLDGFRKPKSQQILNQVFN
ncbi:DNA repair protein RecO [Flavobacteriaceae bacterium MHTCC 0001]